MLKSAWFIARQELSFSLRQKETIIWTFVMPILFFFFFGSMSQSFEPKGDENKPDGIAVRGTTAEDPLVAELLTRLEAENFAIVWIQDEEAFKAAGRRLTIPAPPEGYATLADAVNNGQEVVLHLGREGDSPHASFDRLRVGRAVYGLLADIVVLKSEGVVLSPSEFERLKDMPRSIAIETQMAGKRKTIPSGYEQTIPGTMVMFTMMILLTSGAILLVIERESGLLRRLASAPISRGSIVLGKWMGKLGLGVVQLAFGMLAGRVIFGLDWGPQLPTIALVLFSWAALNASLGILLGNLARSEAQMSGIGILTSLVLAALGGCWWPIEISPDWMQSIGLALPSGWAMDALHRLISFGYGPASVLPHLAAISGLALFIGWLGTRSFRYQ